MNSPNIRRLNEKERAKLENFLRPRIETSMFLLSNMRNAGLVYNGQKFGGHYVASFEDDAITGVVAHFWNRMLNLQAPENLDLLWKYAVHASNWGIKGLIGPANQVSDVLNALEVTEANNQLDETEFLYALPLRDLHIPEILTSKILEGRQIAPRDVDLLTRWRVAYSIETMGVVDSPELWEQSRSSIESAVKIGRTWVIEKDGKVVATSAFNAEIQEAVQVGGVYTPPELRSLGYGRAAVAASLLDAREKGVQKGILFTGKTNFPAQKAYESLGFEIIGDYRLKLFKNEIKPNSVL